MVSESPIIKCRRGRWQLHRVNSKSPLSSGLSFLGSCIRYGLAVESGYCGITRRFNTEPPTAPLRQGHLAQQAVWYPKVHRLRCRWPG